MSSDAPPAGSRTAAVATLFLDVKNGVEFATDSEEGH